MTFIPNDQAARDRIEYDLAGNLMVQAGAGSGKTTSLVRRMVQHVRSGTSVERIAAVTFTRKAANELRERFRNALEAELRSASTDAPTQARVALALHDIDRAFLGTIHAFCGRILREHPLQAGLDPTFQEVSGEDMSLLEQAFWRRWIDREERSGNADLAAVRNVGIDPAELYESFLKVRTYPDVTFETEDRPVPDIAACQSVVEELLRQAHTLRPASAPEDGWDALMSTTKRLERSQRLWQTPAGFCAAVAGLSAAACKLTQKRWGTTKEAKAAAKALGEAFVACVESHVSPLLQAWREHRYPIVMRVLQQAARAFEHERRATGQLGFEDLLMLTAALLRDYPAVRDSLGARYAHLLVDEFQDTDPVQAEVCLLLASPSSDGTDWRTVTPRAGSLFVVGDPKQSIYRFRRADIGVYEFVKQRMAATGDVLALTTNFRSVHAIGGAVNDHFSTVFGPSATPEQAAYSPMLTMKDGSGEAVARYHFTLPRRGSAKDVVVETDAQLVSSYIVECIEHGGRSPGDFLILTRTKFPIAHYARALARQNIPATTTGAGLSQEHELRELMVVLRAIADPENGVCVAAALEGLFFGLSPADLWEGKQEGLRFAITHRPAGVESRTGKALLCLYEWWTVSQREPADVLIERVLDDTGLLFHATSQELGDARAGAFLHIVERMRAASTLGAGSVMAAIERIDALLRESLDDISLRPGRADAVRVMNVHQAKGLEAPVVILAAPVDKSSFNPQVHIRRSASGAALGGLIIGYKQARVFVVLAQCPRWAQMQEAESRYEAAEEARLLYVAATRAREQLVVSQFTEIPAASTTSPDAKVSPDDSVWRPLAPMLERLATELTIANRAPVDRREVPQPATAIQQAVADAKQVVNAARKASITVQTVTQSAKESDEVTPYVLRKSSGGKGKAWGSAVHRIIEAYLRGRRGAGLLAFARAVAMDERLAPPLEAELLAFAEGAGTAAWSSVMAPGAVAQGATITTELTIMRHVVHENTAVITEGVIDAAALQDDAWSIVDWKSDSVDAAEWSRRQVAYRRQVETYGDLLTSLTGLPATVRVERIVTAQSEQ